MSFNLEKSISAWRRSFATRRAFLEEDLQELELHLRDHVKHCVQNGSSEEMAFKEAVYHVGDPFSAEREYDKVYWGKLKRKQKRLPDISWRFAMFRSYIKIAIRSLWKHKITSGINITGLAIGMACCLVVLYFVRDESSYDTYHELEERLYRLSINSVTISTGQEQLNATTPILWGPAMKRDYPEVEEFVRFVRLTGRDNPWKLTVGENSFFEFGGLHADPSALEVFSWPMIQGDPATALTEPGTVVITESLARKYFGEADPMGQTITLDPRLRDDEGQFTGAVFPIRVTGVLKDIPNRSHFTFDYLLPSVGLNGIYGGDINTGTGMNSWFWRGSVGHTYLVLAEGADPAQLEAKFADFQDRYLGDATRSRGYYYAPFLQQVSDIYLDGNMSGEMRPAGDSNSLIIFSIVALFILFIACVNFTNLSTAMSASRSREVGLRKVVGAHRGQLILQFLGESVVISAIAFVVAIVLAAVVLPLFYGYLNKDLVINYREELPFLSALLLIGLVVGISAGSYPAFFLSRFKPIQAFKGFLKQSLSSVFLRKGLIVFQFVISAFLIIATITVYQQLNFMRSHDLGFEQEHIIVVPPSSARSVATQYETIREELLKNPGIADVTMSSGVPGQGGGGDLYVEKGAAVEASFRLGELFVDYNFADMFGLELIAGRDFSRDYGTDAGVRDENGYFVEVTAILNEEAVRQFGWSSPEEAIGKQIIRDPNAGDWTANVIGVTKDFHFANLRQPIGPGVLILLPSYSYLSVRMHPGEIKPILADLEEKMGIFAPETAFGYNFLEASFRAQYEEEQRLGEVFSYISSLAILIACLGLFGLAAFTVNQRIKEIGIRKSLGASIFDIVVLLSRGFSGLVIIAIVLAFPLAYWITEWWLQEYPYRVGFTPWVYAIAGVLAWSIAILTISYQTVRAARSNPVQSLRYD